MSDGTKIYLCRMFSKEHRCIGRACGYLTDGGRCLIAGDDPPSRWTGKARVIAVTQEQLSTGDVEYGFAGTHDCDYGMTHAPTEARGKLPDLSGMDARQIADYMNDHMDERR